MKANNTRQKPVSGRMSDEAQQSRKGWQSAAVVACGGGQVGSRGQ